MYFEIYLMYVLENMKFTGYFTSDNFSQNWIKLSKILQREKVLEHIHTFCKEYVGT